MVKHLMKELNQFSLPLVINNYFNVIISSLLAVMVGRISMNAIVVTNIVDEFMFALTGLLGVCVLSFTIYASRVTTSQLEEFNDYFKSILLLNGWIGLATMGMLFLFSHVILARVYGLKGISLQIGCMYMNISGLQLWLTMIIFACTNQLKVRKKTVEIVQIGIFSSLLQVVVAYILLSYVLYGEYKVVGVAIASCFATAFSLLCYGFILRKDLRQLRKTKSSKKIFLLKKSGLLLGQELLEGTVFSMVFSIVLSRLGPLNFSAYHICKTCLGMFLAPMYMYCNGLVIMTGEKIGKKDKQSLHVLPYICLGLIVGIYFSLVSCTAINKATILGFFTEDNKVLMKAIAIFWLVVLSEGVRPLFEVGKYSMQALGEEKKYFFALDFQT